MVDIKDSMIKNFKLMLEKVIKIKDGYFVMFTEKDLMYYYILSFLSGGVAMLFVISIF